MLYLIYSLYVAQIKKINIYSLIKDILISVFAVPLLQQSDDDVIKFESLVLLHDMVSQVTSF